MEAHSLPGRVLCTQKTSDLLVAAGKKHWLTEREGLASVKGKGSMKCYWCVPRTADHVSLDSGSTSDMSPSMSNDNIVPTHTSSSNTTDVNRLVEWVTKLFEEAIEKIAASSIDLKHVRTELMVTFKAPREEVSETIVLSNSNLASQNDTTRSSSRFGKVARKQLEEYISSIANAYRSNSFHNFEHACHVIMATKKLLLRVIKPMESSVSSTSYGLTSDPLTHFGILLSALIHDVDHPGVSNAQLIKETDRMAVKYNNQSVAEQNSVTLAWDLLMQSKFSDLQSVIAPSQNELARLRQIVVNSVIATDLFDTELRSFRENRWMKAFGDTTSEADTIKSVDCQSNLRAAIVIEHIIQASDVSHTMQHWHVYQKWNQRLFYEMYHAYNMGRAEKNPANGWYEGELWFFDNYIIPLAKKLKTCGVFGVSCDEFLDYAMDNRVEWKAKGRDIIAQYITDIHAKNDLPRLGDSLARSHRFQVANALDTVVSAVATDESGRSI
jgi:3'5'-cyclic nucleotide phosphodiesterase